jgi:adenylyltransferase/sulfurtransferase
MSEPVDVPEITAAELNARFEAGDAPVLVDVRENFERRIADLPDHEQHRIPTGEFLTRMGEVDRDADIVVYCRSGSRSAWAVRLLQERGYEKVLNLKGGVLAWREDVDPSLRAY